MATTKRKKKRLRTPDLLQEINENHNEIVLKLERVIRMSVKCPEVRIRLIEIKEML